MNLRDMHDARGSMDRNLVFARTFSLYHTSHLEHKRVTEPTEPIQQEKHCRVVSMRTTSPG